MKDSRILSSFQELPHAAGARPLAEMPEHVRARVQVFDTCQVGVVLRAVLFVQAVVAVARATPVLHGAADAGLQDFQLAAHVADSFRKVSRGRPA